MRELFSHICAEDRTEKTGTPALKLTVEDAPGAGGANHLYVIEGHNLGANPAMPKKQKVDPRQLIVFQNGPIKEAGVNGLTHEVLLAILIDRLASFQAGPFPSEYNLQALNHCKCALDALHSRTRDRIKRGVEGRTQV